MPQCLLSVQVGVARKVHIQGRSILTAIHKISVEGAVAVMPLGLLGDEQADPSVHGGLDKAVYAYPSEHYGFWQEARSAAGVGGLEPTLPWGAMGENLTLTGLLEHDVWVGDVLRFADCDLRVTQPREPCFKFNAAMGYPGAVKAMALSGFCGFYLAVETPGQLRAGESFELVPGTRQTSVAQMFKNRLYKHLR
jgi:MOSC domain-containing protein YiiM